MPFDPTSICFIGSDTPKVQEVLKKLIELYGQKDVTEADVIVVLGGDGTMLRALHRFMNTDKKIYGMNYGSIGFLMNHCTVEQLPDRLAKSQEETIRPLHMYATTTTGEKVDYLAINEVSLLRQSFQAAKIQVSIDHKVRIPELVCDGILVATPLGSTAYNLSAQGPIIPMIAPLIALTPVSPYRPRRWHGALLPHNAEIEFKLLETHKRSVNAAADNYGVCNVDTILVHQSQKHKVQLLFDHNHSWDERILAEQFAIESLI